MKSTDASFWRDLFAPWLRFFIGLLPFAVLVIIHMMIQPPAERDSASMPGLPPITTAFETTEHDVTNYCASVIGGSAQSVSLIDSDPLRPPLDIRRHHGHIVDHRTVCASPYLGGSVSSDWLDV